MSLTGKLTCLLTSLACLAWASSSSALQSDTSEPCYISSDQITYDHANHTATYIGHVTGHQGTSILDADKLVVLLDPHTNNIIRLIAYGNPAHYSTIPQAGKSRLYAEAYTINYDVAKQTILLIDHGKVTQDQNIFSGPHIWYDIQKEMVISQSVPGKGKTTVIIQPSNSTPKTKNKS
jgi:lipopolysaccharide export system protein LptA